MKSRKTHPPYPQAKICLDQRPFHINHSSIICLGKLYLNNGVQNSFVRLRTKEPSNEQFPVFITKNHLVKVNFVIAALVVDKWVQSSLQPLFGIVTQRWQDRECVASRDQKNSCRGIELKIQIF